MSNKPGKYYEIGINFDGVVKSPIYCVVVFFQKLGIHMYGLVPEKTLRLVYEPFYLAIYS